MDDPPTQAELFAVLRDLLRALTLLRELTNLLEAAARKLAQVEKHTQKGP